jgi:protein phosphatase
MKEIKLPEIALVLLVGPSSSGKSTFARKYFESTEVLSSDNCRALVSDDENNLDATDDAFEVLQLIAAKRLKRGKLTVVDALNLRREDRAKMVQLAKDNYALAAAIVIETPIGVLFERHATRTDRNFGKIVLGKQFDDLKRSMRSIEKEGFSYVYYVKPEEELTITRQKLWNNKKEEHGPFDIIGDVHGCFDELLELLHQMNYHVVSADGHFTVSHPEGRKVIFLGDLTDRGPKSPEVLRLVMDMVKGGNALCITGNHDEKLNKYLNGKNVPLNHGLEKTAQQLQGTSKEFQREVKDFLYGLIAHYVLDDGKLVVAHAGLPEQMHGRAAAGVRTFCLFGETTGEIDEFGLPVRHDWAKRYRGKAMVVYGHTPIPEPEWVNNTINIDTGCAFGGRLTALRYPERELVTVSSKAIYAEPVRPIMPVEDHTKSQKEEDDLLDVGLVNGKNIIETGFNTKVIIREENAVAALEVMSRFAQDPRWLIYLPPTMSPPETSRHPNFLEHPDEVFKYYIKHGITSLICEEKHMGSRAIAIVLKEPGVAKDRFGFSAPSLGTIYTRTGRKFFDEQSTEFAFLEVLNMALTESGFWQRFGTDWVCLDGELMPWSAKAKDLLVKQYAAVGSAASNGLSASLQALESAKMRGIPVGSLLEAYTSRQEKIGKYITSYRNYSRDITGIEGMVFAPFHLLATEKKTFFDKQHTWHLQEIENFCKLNPKHLMVTPHILVDLDDEASTQAAVDWWLDLTAKGGEGMVVKPLDYIASFKGRMIQPAMKCRGSEYLRIIYGPEYDAPGNMERLKSRNVKVKRDLALQEFTLGLESLSRFVRHEPLTRIHECVFGVLALESEAVDPRL